MSRQAWSTSSPTLRSLSTRHYAVAFGALLSLVFLIFSFRSYSPASLSKYGYSTPTEKFYISTARQASLQPILNSTLGFQKILAISLPARTDHRDGLVLAGAVSNISIDFIDGVDGKSIDKKILPPVLGEHVLEYPGALGAWRAHMNAISQVVQHGWSSALILEDDVDWDVRIHQQLQEFALGSSFVSRHFDQGIQTSAGINHDEVPVSSPYGDDWDVLWFGHCGMVAEADAAAMVFENDYTTPLPDQITAWNGDEATSLKNYKLHSRIVTAESGGTCSLAYAVSQQGARRILYEIGLQKLDGAFDLMLRDFCEGRNGRSPHRCISVLPQLMDHYRSAGAVGGDSDVGGPIESGEVREKDFSFNIRWSVRLNMAKLLQGDTSYSDQYPDPSTNERPAR